MLRVARIPVRRDGGWGFLGDPLVRVYASEEQAWESDYRLDGVAE
jgi:hypothetical protein